MSKKRIALAAAAGITAVGLTAAGASTLNLAGQGAWFNGVAQQSDRATTSCTNGSLEVSFPINDNVVSSAELFQQNIQGCAGKEAQVVLYNAQNDVVAKSVTRRLDANGLNQTLSFGRDINVQDFSTYRVTVGSEIVG